MNSIEFLIVFFITLPIGIAIGYMIDTNLFKGDK